MYLKRRSYKKKLYFFGKRISEISNMFNLQYRSIKRYIEMIEEK